MVCAHGQSRGRDVGEKRRQGGARDGTLLARREDHLRKVAESVTSQTDEERVVVRTHDVRNGDEVPALWESVEREIGPVDLLVYASGVLGDVGPNEYTFAKDREILEINLLGAVAWFDEDPARQVIDDEANATWDKLAEIYSDALNRAKGLAP